MLCLEEKELKKRQRAVNSLYVTTPSWNLQRITGLRIGVGVNAKLLTSFFETPCSSTDRLSSIKGFHPYSF